MRALIDMTGKRCESLTVLRRDGRRRSYAAWLCVCDCGKKLVVSGNELRQGQKSCGCQKSSLISQAKTTHGESGSPLHKAWKNMKTRCYNVLSDHYHRYGGRGITVCDEWRNDAVAFIKWAHANGYAPDLQIDRRDNDKGYCPENCRFVTSAENRANRSPRIVWYDSCVNCQQAFVKARNEQMYCGRVCAQIANWRERKAKVTA
jgi:hypothetical protein